MPVRVLDLEVAGDLQELRDLDVVQRPDVEGVAVFDGGVLGGLLARRVRQPLGRSFQGLDVGVAGSFSSGHVFVLYS